MQPLDKKIHTFTGNLFTYIIRNALTSLPRDIPKEHLKILA